MWWAPLPGLLRHEPLQQGQLVHGAEFHGQSPWLHPTTIDMAVPQL